MKEKNVFLGEEWFPLILDEDVDVFTEEGNLLASLRKSVSEGSNPDEIINACVPFIKKTGGSSSVKKMGQVERMIGGYWGEPTVRGLNGRSDTFKDGKLIRTPCRLTRFTRDNKDEWSSLIPSVRRADKHFKDVFPKQYQYQRTLADKVPDWTIDDTVFSTISVNLNWRTPVHKDKGDLKDGYTLLTVNEKGSWNGCYLGFPEYGVAFNVRQGDIAIIDPHQYHCNTPLKLDSDDAVRLTTIYYMREKIITRCSEPIQVDNTVGDDETKIVTVSMNCPKSKQKIRVRPGTSDESVLKEVFVERPYQRPIAMGFKIKTGQVWLDLGANIGTFALWALERGVNRVVCYEPEPTNYSMLQKNTKSLKNKVILVKEGVDITSGETNLYLPNDVSRPYRASILQQKNNGRVVHSIKTTTLDKILKQYPTVTCIKMDIEGAEIQLLEQDHEWKGITQLAVEYSFDKDPSLKRFYDIIKKLTKTFHVQYSTKVDSNKDRVNYTHFPKQAMIWCLAKDVPQTPKQVLKNKSGIV